MAELFDEDALGFANLSSHADFLEWRPVEVALPGQIACRVQLVAGFECVQALSEFATDLVARHLETGASLRGLCSATGELALLVEEQCSGERVGVVGIEQFELTLVEVPQVAVDLAEVHQVIRVCCTLVLDLFVLYLLPFGRGDTQAGEELRDSALGLGDRIRPLVTVDPTCLPAGASEVGIALPGGRGDVLQDQPTIAGVAVEHAL